MYFNCIYNHINYTYYTYIILMMFVDVYGDHFKMILRLENRKAKGFHQSTHCTLCPARVDMRRLKSCIGLATNVEEWFVLAAIAQSPMMYCRATMGNEHTDFPV